MTNENINSDKEAVNLKSPAEHAEDIRQAIDWLKTLSKEYSDAESSGDRKDFKSSMSKLDLVVLTMSSLSLALWMVTVSFAILERL